MRGHRKRERIFPLHGEFQSDHFDYIDLINDTIRDPKVVIEKFNVAGRIGKSLDDEGNISLYDEVQVKMEFSDYGFEVDSESHRISLVDVDDTELERLEDDPAVVILFLKQISLSRIYNIAIIRDERK